MSSHPSAPAITAHVAMTRMSVSLCSLLAVSMRGSGKSANTVVSERGIGYPPDALGVAATPTPSAVHSALALGSNQASHNMWDTIQEAQQAYRKVEEQIDKEGLKSFGVHGMLTIRHLNETKGGTQHRKIAFAHGIK